MAVFERDDADLQVPVERLTAALANKNPKAPSYDRALGELGQAVARFLRGSGSCGEQDIEAAVAAMNSFAFRHRVGDIPHEVFSAGVTAVIGMATNLPQPVREKALSVTEFAAGVVAKEQLPAIAGDIAAAARIPVVNLPRTYGLTLIENQLTMGNPQTCGAEVHQLIRQLTGGINQ